MNAHEQMLTAILDCRRVDLHMERPALSADQTKRYRQMQERRASGEPLQYIIGDCDFLGLRLCVDERVLIPRPETEILVDYTMQNVGTMLRLRSAHYSKHPEQGRRVRELSLQGDDRPLRILDIGTGSGNIAIALAKNLPFCQVTALDISQQAIALARKNAQRHGVEHRIKFIGQDMRRYFQQALPTEKFDIIISNPPYIPRAQLADLPRDVQQEPRIALDGGPDGLFFLRTIIKHSRHFLNQGGFLFLEIGDGQSEAIERIFQRYPCYQEIRFLSDYTGTKRIVTATLRSQDGKVNH